MQWTGVRFGCQKYVINSTLEYSQLRLLSSVRFTILGSILGVVTPLLKMAKFTVKAFKFKPVRDCGDIHHVTDKNHRQYNLFHGQTGILFPIEGRKDHRAL